MKRAGLLLIAFALITSIFTGCSLTTGNAQHKLKVYTSFYPIYDFASKIGGDKAEVVNLVPPGIEPHDWEPSPSDIVNLEKADLFIYNGAGMEQWADKVIDTIQSKKLTVLEASQGISLINDYKNAKTQISDDVSTADPHVWLSIRNAKVQMENIKKAFISADKANEQYYSQNYNRYSAELDKLDKEYKDTISSLPNKEIVVAHDAFSYLCVDYGINQVAIDGLSPDSEPDPARMAEIIGFVKEHNVKIIFFEELVSPKIAETIAKETGTKTDVLNPLEGLTDEQLANGSDYISVMRENLNALKSALE